MGTTAALKELETKEIFCEDKLYIANKSYLVAVPAVLSLLLGRSFGLNMVPEPLELLPLGPRLLLEAYGSHDQ